MEISIQKLENTGISEFTELVNLFKDVFEMEDFTLPERNHIQKLLDRDDFVVFIALDNEKKVVGGLTTYVLEQYYSDKPLAYIYDLAVSKKLQRQGIGQRLIAETIRFYKSQGFEEVFVQADKIDQDVLEFYRKTNPSKEEDVAQFSFKLE